MMDLTVNAALIVGNLLGQLTPETQGSLQVLKSNQH